MQVPVLVKFQNQSSGFVLCIVCKHLWSGTPRGRISGCVDRVYSVCYLQV